MEEVKKVNHVKSTKPKASVAKVSVEEAKAVLEAAEEKEQARIEAQVKQCFEEVTTILNKYNCIVIVKFDVKDNQIIHNIELTYNSNETN